MTELLLEQKRGFLELAKKNSTQLEIVFKECLKATKDEKILIVGDTGIQNQYTSALLSYSYFLATKNLKLRSKMILQKRMNMFGKISDNVINEIEKMPNGSIIILNLSNKFAGMGKIGKSFRKFCKKKEHRFVSTTSLGFIETEKIDKIINPLNTDYTFLKKKHDVLKARLDRTNEINIFSVNGTDLLIKKKSVKCHCADGIYDKYGTGGNLPAGEVYFAPKKVEGRVVIDASSRNKFGTTLINEPIKIDIKNNHIINISGGKEADLLSKTLELAESRARFPKRVRHIGEIGIGINPKAEVIGSTIIDEKVLGTAHIGIGSNYWFGGDNKTIVHLDQVFYNPEIILDDELLKI